MASISIKLDTRSVKKDGTSPIVALVSAGSGKSFRMPLGISVSSKEWDANKSIVKSHPSRLSYNIIISQAQSNLKAKLLNLDIEGRLANMELKDIQFVLKRALRGQDENNDLRVVPMFDMYIEGLTKTSTKGIYELTKRKIVEYYGDILLSSINVSWLKDFERRLLKLYKKNGVSIHMRNLRAVINDAMNRELLTNYKYPFRIYKIPKEPTAKRDLSIEDIRLIRDYDAEPEMR